MDTTDNTPYIRSLIRDNLSEFDLLETGLGALEARAILDWANINKETKGDTTNEDARR